MPLKFKLQEFASCHWLTRALASMSESDRIIHTSAIVIKN